MTRVCKVGGSNVQVRLSLISHPILYVELANAGVGVHHAGLNIEDRRATEALYLDGSLRVVVATSVCYVVNERSLQLTLGIDAGCRREPS